MGPFRMSDLPGNDIGWAIRKRRAKERRDLSYSKVGDLLCERGRFGQKMSAGWYDYKPGDRNASPSTAVTVMTREYAASRGVPQREIADDEIVGRLVYALVNEGARILKEGIAARVSDIDIVYHNGYGFLPSGGGPMFYAETVGLYNVLRSMRGYEQGYQGAAWKPAPLIERFAETGGPFSGSASRPGLRHLRSSQVDHQAEVIAHPSSVYGALKGASAAHDIECRSSVCAEPHEDMVNAPERPIPERPHPLHDLITDQRVLRGEGGPVFCCVGALPSVAITDAGAAQGLPSSPEPYTCGARISIHVADHDDLLILSRGAFFQHSSDRNSLKLAFVFQVQLEIWEVIDKEKRADGLGRVNFSHESRCRKGDSSWTDIQLHLL